MLIDNRFNIINTINDTDYINDIDNYVFIWRMWY